MLQVDPDFRIVKRAGPALIDQAQEAFNPEPKLCPEVLRDNIECALYALDGVLDDANFQEHAPEILKLLVSFNPKLTFAQANTKLGDHGETLNQIQAYTSGFVGGKIKSILQNYGLSDKQLAAVHVQEPAPIAA